MMSVLPQRAKTWASIKTGIANSEIAARELIGEYLKTGAISNSHYNVSYEGSRDSISKGSSKSGSKSGGIDNTDAGFWTQLQAGQGGDEAPYTILNGKGMQSITGKYYGVTPGLDNNKSLGDYISDSKVGYLIKNTHNITFGDIPISTDSFNDVMINAASGVMAVTLPKKLDGTVDLSVAKTYNEITTQLRDEGL